MLGKAACAVSAAVLAVAGPLASARAAPAPAVRAAPVSLAGGWTVTEPETPPNSHLTATVTRDSEGALTLTIRRNQATVLQPSALGVKTTGADFTNGLHFLSRSDRTVAEAYRTTTGKRLLHHSVMNEMRLEFATADGARMDLVVRVADDGVAYRYVIPGSGTVSVTGEASSFGVPPSSPAFLLPYSPNYENKRFASTVGQAASGDYAYPSLFQVGNNWMLVTEAGVIDQYGGTRLALDSTTHTFRVQLPDQQETSSAPMRTPWRVAIVGSLAQVVDSDLVNDLAEPSRIKDTSWIKPGRVAWSWWSDHSSPSSFDAQKRYVDFAQRMGWEYVLVDAGWDPSWIPTLVQYARARGVKINLWANWTQLETEQERQTLLPTWKSWGIAGVKIDFMDSDSQATMRWYKQVLDETAQLHLMVNFHGATIPRGLQRTWPNVMTVEAVRGAEYYTFCCDVGPDHNTMLPFTRNVVGSMDYTPVTFSASKRTTSDGHELGLSVVYESGWQHFADSPQSYDSHPLAESFLAQVPTVWDETRFVMGYPGKLAVFARRHGTDWYIGGSAAGQPRQIQVPLRFLHQGQWLAVIIHDGNGGLVKETHIVTPGDKLDIPLAENGGFVAHLCAAHPGRTSCAGS